MLAEGVTGVRMIALLDTASELTSLGNAAMLMKT